MWYNRFVELLLRSPLHGLVSPGVMLITYTGRKSGQKFTVPVNYVYEEENILLTTSFKKRTWWRSLRGGVPVTLRLRGKDVAAAAQVFEDDEAVARFLTVYFDRFPKMADYCYVTLAADGTPDPDELAAAAAKRVIVRAQLPDP